MTTPDTKRQAYIETIESGEDVSLRKRVAAQLATESLTTPEIADRLDKSKNAVRPRVNELIRMQCVTRQGTRENPSGHAAAVHHLTERGERYLRGEVDPEPLPTVAQAKSDVVDVARKFLRGEVEREILGLYIDRVEDLEAMLNADNGNG